jgi:hypothetical protein
MKKREKMRVVNENKSKEKHSMNNTVLEMEIKEHSECQEAEVSPERMI